MKRIASLLLLLLCSTSILLMIGLLLEHIIHKSNSLLMKLLNYMSGEENRKCCGDSNCTCK